MNLEFKKMLDGVTEEFGSLTLRERSVLAMLFEDEVEDVELYKEAIKKYRDGTPNPKSRVVKGSKDQNYMVEYYEDGRHYCSCPNYQYRLSAKGGKEYCKHILNLIKKG